MSKKDHPQIQELSSIVERCVHPSVATEFNEMMGNLKIYQATRLSQVLEAVYGQGKKDALEPMQAAIAESKRAKLIGKPVGSSKRR